MARILLGFIFSIFIALPAARAQEEPVVWVQIEAQPSLTEAQTAARRYGASLADVNGFSLGNGWYAIALGPYRQEEAERVLQVYRAEGVIARDSYIAASSDYQQQFWPIGANLLDGQVAPAPTAPDSPSWRSTRPPRPPPNPWTRRRARPARARASLTATHAPPCKRR